MYGCWLPIYRWPFPISWTPFGELFSGVLWVCLLSLLHSFIQTGNIQSYVIWLSVPIVITIGFN